MLVTSINLLPTASFDPKKVSVACDAATLGTSASMSCDDLVSAAVRIATTMSKTPVTQVSVTKPADNPTGLQVTFWVQAGDASGLTAFTTFPLRAVSLTGFGLALLAFGYGLYLTACYLMYGHEVGGWTTIVVSLMGFAGIQLISLGIVGEYVGRIFEEVKARPLFVVKRELGQGLKSLVR